MGRLYRARRESASDFQTLNTDVVQNHDCDKVRNRPEATMKKYVVSAIVIGCFSLVLAEDAKQIVSEATNAPSPAAVAKPQAKKEESYPVIGYLEKRDRVITIKSSPQGTIYSIATKEGKILHENL
jgi:hypothetical protein